MNIDDKRLKIFKNLLDRPNRDWNITDISEASGVSQPTTTRIVREMEDEKIISTRKKGNMKFVELEKRRHVKELVNVFNEEHRPMRETAVDFVKELEEDIPEVKKCLLFGSVARGTADLESDIDILVLVEEENQEIKNRIMLKAERVEEETGYPLSTTIMGLETYGMHLKEGSQFSESVERDKEVLYDGTSERRKEMAGAFKE